MSNTENVHMTAFMYMSGTTWFQRTEQIALAGRGLCITVVESRIFKAVFNTRDGRV
jgi:hypothetical protein